MTKILKPPFTMSIALVNAGHTLPIELLTKLSAENPSAYGHAIRTKKNMDVELFSGEDLASDSAERLEFLKEINENTKEHWRMFCFSNYQTDFDSDEIQPVVIIRDKKSKDPMLAIAVEGDFPKFTDNEEAWSEPFYLIDSWLGPKIESVLDLAGGSNHKLYEYLNGAQFAKDFAEQTGHRGVIGVMPLVGAPVMIGKNDQGVKGDWGSCSFAYGYTESVQEAGTAEPATSKRVSKYSSNPTQPAPVSSPPQADPEPVKKDDPIGAAAAKFIETKEERSPPPNLQGKALKRWYCTTEGTTTPRKDWANRPSVIVLVRRSVDTGAAVNPPATSAAALMAAHEQGETLPIISKEDIASVNEFIKKCLGDGSMVVDDPVRAAEDEARLATFTELTRSAGITGVKDFLRWRTSFIFALAKKDPRAFALAFIDLRNSFGMLVEAGDKKMGELPGDATKDSGGTTTESTTSSQPTTKRISKYAANG